MPTSLSDKDEIASMSVLGSSPMAETGSGPLSEGLAKSTCLIRVNASFSFFPFQFLQDCPPAHRSESRAVPQDPGSALQRTTLPKSVAVTDGIPHKPNGVDDDDKLNEDKHRKGPDSWYHSDVDILSHNELLSEDYAPNIIHLVWCGRRWFEFHHYISVRSLIKELRPDEIDFYYDVYPILDYWLYNNWIDELKEEFPFFRTIQIDNQRYGAGCSDSKPNRKYALHLLNYYGGIYLNEHTIVNHFPAKWRSSDLIDALDPVTGMGFMMAKRGLPLDTQFDQVKNNKTLKIKTFACISQHEYNANAKFKPPCINTKDLYFPKDIWELDSPWGELVRRILYGRPEIPWPKQDFSELIPNIAHVVWIGGGEMDFLFYLCVLSLLYVQEVETLYIHGDAPPSGPLWAKIKDNPRIKLIHRY